MCVLSQSKLLITGSAMALLMVCSLPAEAQQYRGGGNNRIRSVGDIAPGKINPKVNLRFRTQGLFSDSEVFGQFSAPRPFLFSVPNFAERGLDFSGLTFEEYLDVVANTYEMESGGEYFFRFGFANTLSARGELLYQTVPSLVDEVELAVETERQRILDVLEVDSFAQIETDELRQLAKDQLEFIRFSEGQARQSQALREVHENDYLAGGGFFRLVGDPTIPGPVFPGLPGDPTVPDLPDPDFPGLPDPDAPDDPDFPGLPTDSLVAQDSGSLDEVVGSARGVVFVPEPATLGLMVLGATSLLSRSRRR